MAIANTSRVKILARIAHLALGPRATIGSGNHQVVDFQRERAGQQVSEDFIVPLCLRQK